SGTLELYMPVSERVEEYRQKLLEYRLLQGEQISVMGKDVEKTRRAAVRSELIALRTELTGLVNARTASFKKDLYEVPTAQQKNKGALPEPAPSRFFIKSIDWLTRWGLTVIGLCLMLGLFSRSAAAAGAIFLLMTVLTAPALPWHPAPPNAEGSYL